MYEREVKMEDIFQKLATEGKEIEPVATIDGEPVYTIHDAQKLNQLELTKEKIVGKQISLEERPIADDGIHYLRSKAHNKAINVDNYCENAYRVVKNKTRYNVEVVTDYRAIKEKERNGTIWCHTLNTYIIGMANGDLKLVGRGVVTDKEFIDEFNHKLSNEDMKKVKNLIAESGEPEKPEGDSLEELLNR